jgi:hypothetical protein
VMLLVMAANEYDSLAEPEQAARVLERAQQVSRALLESHANIYLMTYECVRARRNGRLDQAQRWLDEVTRAAGQSFIGPVQALLATQQAWIMLERGDFADAEAQLRTAFEYSLANRLDRPDVGAVIEARAALESARGDAAQAAWLHGLFVVARGHELPASATPDLAATARKARAELGDEAYGAAYARGRAVRVDTVLEACLAVFGVGPEIVPGWWSRRDLS